MALNLLGLAIRFLLGANVQTKQNQLRLRALDAVRSGRLEEALKSYSKIWAKSPLDEEAMLNIGLIYESLGRKAEYISHSLECFKRQPNNPRLIARLAASEYSQGHFRAAYDRIVGSIAEDDLDFDAVMVMCASAAALGMEQESLKYALDAVHKRPTSALAHSNLGGGFLSMGRFTEAKMCFETALILEPENAHAYTNLGVIESQLGQRAKAADYAEKALALFNRTNNHNEINRAKFHLALNYLSMGMIEKAWDYYSSGLMFKGTSSREPQRMFSCPEWTNQDIKDKILMVWREQGLGDEIHFYSAIKYALRKCQKLIIECDIRLIPLLKRSYPEAEVRPNIFINEDPSFRSPLKDYDYHISVGQLYTKCYSTKKKFKEVEVGYLKPDIDRVTFYNKRLGPRNRSIRIGVSWRSGLLTPTRIRHYTSLTDWGAIFNLPELQFVNLQYGDTKIEIKNAEEKFNISLNSWGDLDRKDQLDDLAALIKNLDVVISVPNAVSQMAGALGVKTLWMNLHADPFQIGEKTGYPNYPNVEVFTPNDGDELKALLSNEIPRRILELKEKFSNN